MKRREPPVERPTVRRDLAAKEFPFTMQAHCEETRELLWQYVCHGPGPITVPDFAPREVAITVIAADGSTSTLHELPPQPPVTAGMLLDCPKCGHPAGLIIGTTQATCSNPDDSACDVVMWNPSLPDGGLNETTIIKDIER